MGDLDWVNWAAVFQLKSVVDLLWSRKNRSWNDLTWLSSNVVTWAIDGLNHLKIDLQHDTSGSCYDSRRNSFGVGGSTVDVPVIARWGFPARKMGGTQARWMVFVNGKHPIVRNGWWLGVALFQETPIWSLGPTRVFLLLVYLVSLGVLAVSSTWGSKFHGWCAVSIRDQCHTVSIFGFKGISGVKHASVFNPQSLKMATPTSTSYCSVKVDNR